MNNPADTLAALAPCPFCGGLPRHLEHQAGLYQESVICDHCFSEGHEVATRGLGVCVTAWNRRASLKGEAEPVAWIGTAARRDLASKGHAVVYAQTNPAADDNERPLIYGDTTPPAPQAVRNYAGKTLVDVLFEAWLATHPTPSPAPQGVNVIGPIPEAVKRGEKWIVDVGPLTMDFRSSEGATAWNTLRRMISDNVFATPPAQQPGEVAELRAEVERLNAIINTPQADDFLRAVSTEAEHQRQRWGNDHDSGKTPADWFWLIGYLAGKALHATMYGLDEKAEHHVITTAAACANWHRAMKGETNMRPGIDGAAALAPKEKGNG